MRRRLATIAVALHLPVATANAKIHRTYATCYNDVGKTASGYWTNRRTAASNFIPFRTRIRIIGPHAGPGGIRRYIIRDTGAPWALGDGHLDLWSPNCAGWPNPPIRWREGW